MNSRIRSLWARKAVAVILSLCLVSPFSTALAAGEGKDIQGHWAEKQLKAWIDKGYIQGYADGTVKPDNTVTRAEFVTLVNRSFGLKEQAEVKAKDIDPKSWEYEQIAIALKAGYISGYEDGTMRPGNRISRQEAAVMLANLLKLDITKSIDLSRFKDAGKLPEWSKGALGAVVAKGLFDGYQDGSLGFENQTTRAEAVVTLERARAAGQTTYQTTYHTAGTHGPASGSQTIEGDVLIDTAGITLQNVTITGNLTLGAGIGEGDVTLRNVTVKGNTYVNGGGANSIHLVDTVLVTLVVDKKTGDVRIVAEGKTSVQQVDVQTGAKIDDTQATGNGFANVKLTTALPAGSNVTLLGSFENLEILSKSIAVEIPAGSVKNVTVADNAGDTTLNVGKDAKIVDLVLNAVLKVIGEGKIDKATINSAASNTTFQTQPGSKTGSGTGDGGGGAGGSTGSSSGGGSTGSTGSSSDDTSARTAAPTANLPAGEATAGTQVTLSTTTAGATIYYTLDGSPPTTLSTAYSGPITINTSLTIKAIAVRTGMTNSVTAEFAYTVRNTPLTPEVSSVKVAANADRSITVSGMASNATDLRITLISPDGQRYPHLKKDGITLNADGSFTFTSGADLYAGDWGYSVIALNSTTESAENTGTVKIISQAPQSNPVTAVVYGNSELTMDTPTTLATGYWLFKITNAVAKEDMGKNDVIVTGLPGGLGYDAMIMRESNGSPAGGGTIIIVDVFGTANAAILSPVTVNVAIKGGAVTTPNLLDSDPIAVRINPAGAQRDTVPPETVTNLVYGDVTSHSLQLTWNASSDNVGTVGYAVYQNNLQIGTVTNTVYKVSGLSPATSYLFGVKAFDAAGNYSNVTTVNAVTKALSTFTVSSTGFPKGGSIPLKYAFNSWIGASNTSIPLRWNHAPAGTRSFAIIMYDSDASNWLHWAVVDIPSTITSLAEGASGSSMPPGSKELYSDFLSPGYGGPMPPSGTHHYHVVVYALNTNKLDGLDANPPYYGYDALLSKLKGKVLGRAETTGTFTFSSELVPQPSVQSVMAVDGTTVHVTFNQPVGTPILSADYSLDQGLNVTSAYLFNLDSSNRTVELKTGPQDSTKTYALRYKGISTGKSFPGFFDVAQAVAADSASLRVEIMPGDSLESITKDVMLPINGRNGTTISWSSGNPGVIADNGVVKRPNMYASDATVTITATISKGGTTEKKSFVLTVKRFSPKFTIQPGNLPVGYSSQDLLITATDTHFVPGGVFPATIFSINQQDYKNVTGASTLTVLNETNAILHLASGLAAGTYNVNLYTETEDVQAKLIITNP